jgi:K+-transporting ATPase KdpF subunit
MDGENLIGLILAVFVGIYVLYCLFRPEDF